MILMKKFAALFLALLLSLSLATPAALCADEAEPPSPGQEEPITPVNPAKPEEPDEPLQPMSEDDTPRGDVVTL